MATPSARLAVLLSGTGSTLVNPLAEIDGGRVPAEVAVVLSDREGAGGLDHARARGIPVAVVPRKAHPERARFSHAVEEALRPHAPDLVVHAGFLSIYDVPADLQGRSLNVHPSLLPSFGGKGCYGVHVHRMVLAAGCRVSGCTVHYVTNEVDGGPIVAQASVPVLFDDTPETLAARVQEAERALYPQAIADILAGRLRLEGDRVVQA